MFLNKPDFTTFFKVAEVSEPGGWGACVSKFLADKLTLSQLEVGADYALHKVLAPSPPPRIFRPSYGFDA